MTLKVYIWPHFGDEPDSKGDGGVRRVVEAQRRGLPEFGIEVVDTPEQADVLAAHMTAPPQFYTTWADKPLVAHNHGFYWDGYDWGDWALRDNKEVMRLVLAADAVTGPSEWVSRVIRRHTSRAVETIYHGVEMPASVQAPAEPRYVLWNKTRIDPICDARPVLEAAIRLPDVRFRSTFIPEGTSRPANLELTGRLGHEEAIAEVQHAGVYLATTRETFGIGTLEAMAAGVPVVGFRFGGQAEFVEHLKDGYLAEPGDWDDLAAGIRWALHYRDQVGAWARHKAARFGWSQFVESYADIYKAVYQARLRDGVTDPGGPTEEDTSWHEPLVSVIVPAYNLARFLPAALQSVKTQTFTDWECIVVDDASPDDCGRIADEFAAEDSRFRVIHNATNQYLAEARNTGIREARGRYVLPLDADDLLAPNAVELLAGVLDRERETHVAYGGVRFVEEDGITPTVYQGHQDQPGYSGWPHPFDIGTLMSRPGQPLPYASMFRREAWYYTGGYRRRCRTSEDCDFWMRLASNGFSMRLVTNSPLLIYRNRPDSMSRTVGWADVENKAWFPWRNNPEIMPAGGRPRTSVPLWDPLVTVIIACGPAHLHLLQDAIDSVAAQTEPRWQCVVVDDTGESLEPPQSWVEMLDVRDHYRATEGRDPLVPAGVVRARNLGLQIARGRYVIFLDADDYLQPDAIELHLEAERAAGGEAVVYGDFWSEYADGRMVNDPMPDYDCSRVLRQSLHAVTALYPRSALERVQGFTPNRPWEDWDLQLKLAAEGVCSMRLAYPTWTYRKDTGTRREDRYARREDGKAAMLEVWGDYMEGRKQLMACAACGQGRAVWSPPAAERNAQFNARPENMPSGVWVEYVGNGEGKQSLRGPSPRDGGTGTLYHFQPRRAQLVHVGDWENRFAGRPDFRLADRPGNVPVPAGMLEAPTSPVLTAPGPMPPAPASFAAPTPEAAAVMSAIAGAGSVVAPPPPDLPPELAPEFDPTAHRPPPFAPPPRAHVPVADLLPANPARDVQGPDPWSSDPVALAGEDHAVQAALEASVPAAPVAPPTAPAPPPIPASDPVPATSAEPAAAPASAKARPSRAGKREQA